SVSLVEILLLLVVQNLSPSHDTHISHRTHPLQIPSSIVPHCPPTTLLTPLQLAVHHVFSTDKAKTDLGYQPIVDPRHAMDATRAYWRRTAQREVPKPPLIVWVLVPLGLALLYLSAFYPRPSLPPPVCWVQDLGVFLFMSRSMLQTVWWTALAIHLTEASIAWMVARNSGGSGARGAEVDGLEWDDGEGGKVGPWSERQNAAEWFVQTFLFGFWSLRLLLRRVVWRMVDSEQNQQ
ncbi:unnamed protein product, partial [Closterium sp. NIES-65]